MVIRIDSRTIGTALYAVIIAAAVGTGAFIIHLRIERQEAMYQSCMKDKLPDYQCYALTKSSLF